jgi:hypothetical protein
VPCACGRGGEIGWPVTGAQARELLCVLFNASFARLRVDRTPIHVRRVRVHGFHPCLAALLEIVRLADCIAVDGARHRRSRVTAEYKQRGAAQDQHGKPSPKRAHDASLEETECADSLHASLRMTAMTRGRAASASRVGDGCGGGVCDVRRSGARRSTCCF